MNARFLSICALALSLAFVAGFRGDARANGGDTAGSGDLFTTEHQEQIVVQSCADFDLLATYTASRDYRLVNDPAGDLVHEWRHVRFAGIVANSELGTSLSFDGEFTRIADYDAGTASTRGFILWDGVPGEGSTLVTIDGRLGALPGDLPALLGAVAPRHLGANLCSILDGQPATGSHGTADLLQAEGSPDESDDDSSSELLPDCRFEAYTSSCRMP